MDKPSISLKGVVINGNKIGRRIGFPTANIRISEDIDIENGVYNAKVEVNGFSYHAMVNIGTKPTISGSADRILEAYLFDFNGDLYGKEIRVTLKQFIRPEQRFDSIEALRTQIEADKNEIIKLLP